MRTIFNTNAISSSLGNAIAIRQKRSGAVAAPNVAPVNSVPAAQSVSIASTLTFSSGNSNLISISDADAGVSSVQVQLTVTLGTLSLSGITGLSFSVGDGSSDTTMTFTGTIAAINTAMAGMIYTPTSKGSALLTIVTNDQGNTGSGGALSDTDTVAIDVQPVNLLLKSQAFDNASWIKSAAAVTANTTTDPLGTTLADSFIASAVDTTHTIRQAVVVTAAQHTYSVFAKAGNQNFMGMYISGVGINNGIMFNVSTGTVGTRYTTPTNVTGAISAAANGYFRCSLTVTTTAATGTFFLYASDADWLANGTNTEAFLGDAIATNTILFGAQLETGATANTYVATL